MMSDIPGLGSDTHKHTQNVIYRKFCLAWLSVGVSKAKHLLYHNILDIENIFDSFTSDTNPYGTKVIERSMASL